MAVWGNIVKMNILSFKQYTFIKLNMFILLIFDFNLISKIYQFKIERNQFKSLKDDSILFLLL